MQQLAVLRLLADGERHSARALAEALGITQADVCEQIPTLMEKWFEKLTSATPLSIYLTANQQGIKFDYVAR